MKRSKVSCNRELYPLPFRTKSMMYNDVCQDVNLTSSNSLSTTEAISVTEPKVEPVTVEIKEEMVTSPDVQEIIIEPSVQPITNETICKELYSNVEDMEKMLIITGILIAAAIVVIYMDE